MEEYCNAVGSMTVRCSPMSTADGYCCSLLSQNIINENNENNNDYSRYDKHDHKRKIELHVGAPSRKSFVTYRTECYRIVTNFIISYYMVSYHIVI